MPIKIFHIIHISKLPFIVNCGFLYSDAIIRQNPLVGQTIGMNTIKDRRQKILLSSHNGLYVGQCVPFYFCPRSVMLYLLHRANHPGVLYRDGQQDIIHLVSDLHKTVDWAKRQKLRWAFTDSNAGSYYFNDFAKLSGLDRIDWDAVHAEDWRNFSVREKKQAEFLVENNFPWQLIEEIGVYSDLQLKLVHNILGFQKKQRFINVKSQWYY